VTESFERRFSGIAWQILDAMTKPITLGEMTAGMAHELNQPLNVIKMES